MGVVFRAYHAELERTVAVKVLQAITPDKDTVARFRHEAQAIARLRHPNIVDVYDFGEFDGTPYMVVEYVPGGNLAGKMSPGGLEPEAALKYLRGIAAGLDYAHGHGIVHRDVKPANVLLSADDSPVLADFGLAKLLEGNSLKSMTGVTTGTPAYMAPEQVTGNQVGPAADRYSLASIAYEMLTGAIPFDGESLMGVLYAQVHRYPSPPSARHSALGPKVDAVIMRGLAKDPGMRWESCGAFVDALSEALGHRAPAANPPTMVMAPPAMKTASVKRAPQPHAAMQATVAVAYPGPRPQPGAAAAPATPGKRRIGRRLIGLAAILVVLISLGVCAAVAQATTLTLDPDRVAPGGTVTVTASHVPAGKAGEIQLLSAFYTFLFRADGNGNVRQDITVPAGIELGDHVVRICWDESCHRSAPLHVVSGAAEASPSAGASPSGSGTSSPQPSPSPGSTPKATSTPKSTPKASPTPTRPPASPTPTKPPPSPSPSPTAYVTVTSISASGLTTVTFHYFYGGATSVSVCQDGTCYPYLLNPLAVTPGASTTVSFKTPVGIKPTNSLLGIGQAQVVSKCCGATSFINVGA
jgi:serine/threonine-protein kinase